MSFAAVKQPSLAFQRVIRANKLCLNGGVDIVRRILAGPAPPQGWTTEELYNLTLKEKPPPNFNSFNETLHPPVGPKAHAPPVPPNQEHPVRSKAFLKRSILPFLEGTQEIHKIAVQRLVPRNALWKITKKGKKVQLNPDAEGETAENVWVWKTGKHPRHGGNRTPEVELKSTPTPTSTAELNPETPTTPTAPQKISQTPSPSASTRLPPEDFDHLNVRRKNARFEKMRAAKQADQAARREALRVAHMEKVLAGVQRAREKQNGGALLRERLAAERQQKAEEARQKKALREEQTPLAKRQAQVKAVHRLKNRGPEGSVDAAVN